MNNNFPKIIEIQTNNYCNSNCTICPYKDMHYKPELMSDELFEKFLKEIKGKDITRIIPYLNNEPFTDNNIISKIERIKNACPNAEIEISTNASLLSEDLILQLRSLNLTELRLSVFGYYPKTYHRMMPKLKREKVFTNLKLISKIFANSKTIVSAVIIDDGSISEEEFDQMRTFCNMLNFQFCRWGFLDRAKNVSCHSNNFYNEHVNFCEQFRPTERMHILSNGNVIFCCQDWSHQYIVGNLKENTIEEIWNSPLYDKTRDMLFNNNLKAPEICCNCKLAHHI